MAYPSTQRGWFARLFARYLLILSLPCLAGGLIYVSVRDAEASRRSADLQEGMQGYAAVLESELDRVDRAVISVAWNPRVTRFARLQAPDPGPDRIRAVEIRRELAAVAEANPFIEEIGLLFARSDVLVTTRSIVFDLPAAYGPYVTLGGLDYLEAKRLLSGSRHWKDLLAAFPLEIGGQRTSGPVYLFTLPLGGMNDLDGAIFAYLSPDELARLARDGHGLAGAAIWVRDAAGTVLASSGAAGEPPSGPPEIGTGRDLVSRRIHGRRLLVTRVRSAARSLDLVAASPLAGSRDGSVSTTGIYLVLVALAASVAVLLAALMARNASRPLTELARLVAEQGSRDTRGSEIHLSASLIIRDLMQENRELQHDHMARQELATDALFRQLLSGERRETGPDMSWIRSHPALTGAAFIVVIARVSGVSRRISREAIRRMQGVRDTIRSLAAGLPESVSYCGEADLNHLLLVLRLSGAGRSAAVREVEGLVELLHRGVAESSSARLSFAAGRAYPDPLDLSLSYEEARFAERSTGAIASLAWYDDALEPSGGIYYPIAVEARIMEALRSGDEAESRRLFDRVFDENRRSDESGFAVPPLLYTEVSATLVKVRDELTKRGAPSDGLPALSRLEHSYGDEGAEEWRLAVRGACRELCGAAEELKKSHNELLKEQLLRYLERHFAEDLSLSRVAGHFGFSQVYLSQFIKEQTGANYLTHVETLRLNRARELLRSSVEIPTSVLAHKVGYRNSNSFRRAFRRRYGASPRDYALREREPRRSPRQRSPPSPDET